MDNSIFPNDHKMPHIITEIVGETGIEAMNPGESTWMVPWAIDVDRSGVVSLNVGMGEREHGPGGTVRLKVVSDFDGLFVDASAMNRIDIEDCFQKGRDGAGIMGWDSSKIVPVRGVLYPLIRDDKGLDPHDVEAFNEAQLEIRQKFAEYYKENYGVDYRFAEDEVSAKPDIGRRVGAVATSGKGRWSRLLSRN